MIIYKNYFNYLKFKHFPRALAVAPGLCFQNSVVGTAIEAGAVPSLARKYRFSLFGN